MLKPTKYKPLRRRFVLKSLTKGVVSFLIVCALSSILTLSLIAQTAFADAYGNYDDRAQGECEGGSTNKNEKHIDKCDIYFGEEEVEKNPK